VIEHVVVEGVIARVGAHVRRDHHVVCIPDRRVPSVRDVRPAPRTRIRLYRPEVRTRTLGGRDRPQRVGDETKPLVRRRLVRGREAFVEFPGLGGDPCLVEGTWRGVEFGVVDADLLRTGVEHGVGYRRQASFRVDRVHLHFEPEGELLAVQLAGFDVGAQLCGLVVDSPVERVAGGGLARAANEVADVGHHRGFPAPGT